MSLSAAVSVMIPAARGALLSRASPSTASMTIAFRNMSSSPAFDYVKLEKRGTDGRVALITLNRPQSLNALSGPLIADLVAAFEHCDRDDSVGCMVVTGSEKAFAAGADIKEMESMDFSAAYKSAFIDKWTLDRAKKPVIAAVNGYALGGGCEVAMMCDIIYAGEKAKFGQPEITLGTLPGAGGTQRLPRAIGKSRAMEMMLTGLPMGAQEAMQRGLVSKVFPIDQLVDEAIKTADIIAGQSKMSARMVKEATNAAYESSLQEGLNTEKRIFYGSFALHDRKEGMNAFVNKRKAKWEDK